MAQRRKFYYPLESWKAEVEKRGLQFLSIKCSRIEPNCVCRASLIVPVMSEVYVVGMYHKIYNKVDMNFNTAGQAFSATNKRMPEYDLKLSLNEEWQQRIKSG